MKAEINFPDHLAEAFDFMAECDGQTPDEYIQGRVILYLQDWLYHIKDPDQGTIRPICGHYGGPNLVTTFGLEEEIPRLLSPIQRFSVCLTAQAENHGP